MIAELRESIGKSTKKGISFTLAALVVWTVIAIIYRSTMEVEMKNFIVFFAGGVMFPLSLLFSKVTGSKWNTNDHPLGSLGLILNFAQLMYFPILFWAFSQAPERFILFYGMITVAHLFPYGWLYKSKVYYGIPPMASMALLLLGGNTGEEALWVSPVIVILSLILLNGGLLMELAAMNRKKEAGSVATKPVKAVK